MSLNKLGLAAAILSMSSGSMIEPAHSVRPKRRPEERNKHRTVQKGRKAQRQRRKNARKHSKR